MITLRTLINRVYLKKDKVHVLISSNLAKEIKLTQKMLRRNIKSKKWQKAVNLVRSSDFVAEVYREQRLKLERKNV